MRFTLQPPDEDGWRALTVETGPSGLRRKHVIGRSHFGMLPGVEEHIDYWADRVRYAKRELRQTQPVILSQDRVEVDDAD